jgi:hypothetical protein
MDYPLLAPVEGRVLECLAVDKAKPGTVAVRDDGFRITQKGKMLQVDMVAIIPPIQMVMAHELWNVMIAMMHTRDQLWLFRQGVPQSICLSEIPRDVLVVTHLLRGGNLVREDVKISRAIAETTSYEKYAESEKFFMHRIAIMRAVGAQPRVRRHIESCRDSAMVREYGESGLLVYALLELFNRSCRAMANELRSPFITFLNGGFKQAEKGYKIFEGFARFNRGLRDPCACLNILNLAHALQSKGAYVSEEDLRRNLPRVL